jgi:pimeloyl-ACP methyl ester carboxylesterase
MATFVLIHGAGGRASSWDLVAPELRAAGHEVLAVDVPTTFLLCKDDRFFPPDWMRQVVRDRLGIEPVEIPGGHCAFLSQPQAMAAAILNVCAASGPPSGLHPAQTSEGHR